MSKKKLLNKVVEHIDIRKVNLSQFVDAMSNMSFSARDLARASAIYNRMLADKECSIILTLAGSTIAAGCRQVYIDMIRNNMVDAIVSTGANIVDMDFFEALGFKHYQGTPFIDDGKLRAEYIDRIYDTYIDEEELQTCDITIKEIADKLEPRAYSSREFIVSMGKFLKDGGAKSDSIIQAAYEKNVPIFCPAFSDSSAGLGLVVHQVEKPDHIAIDSVKDFRELTEVKIKAGTTGIFMIGGGVPKNFVQDTVISAELLNKETEMHKYAIQITVADERDGALSGSTLKEARSWGKVSKTYEQMVFAEATLALPIIASDAYHRGAWKNRKQKNYGKIFS